VLIVWNERYAKDGKDKSWRQREIIEPIHTKTKEKAPSLHNADIRYWSSIKTTSCNY